VLCVQPLPAGYDVGSVAVGDHGHLGRGRGAAELDEARVGQVAQREVICIHPASSPLGTARRHAGPDTIRWADGISLPIRPVRAPAQRLTSGSLT
jgi:hypothetical protein